MDPGRDVAIREGKHQVQGCVGDVGHHGTAPRLFYCWKDEAEQGSKAEDQMVQ